MKLFFTLIIFFAIHILMYGQKDSLNVVQINEVIIKATRLSEKTSNLSTAVTSISFKNVQDKKQQLSINEYLINVPGLFAQNANNFAQDLRVSIRGFGARAAFGIRGVKIIVDGIPETTPDGQGQIDNLNLGIIDNIEVLRGPVSSLYGNASGGVINISTIKEIDKDFVQIGSTFGSYNMQKIQVISGFKLQETDFILLGSHTVSDGYRERSAFENTNFNARAYHRFSDKATLNANINFANSPKANDAGGLKLEDVEANRTQARDKNVLFNTGESIDQFRLSLNYKQKITDNKKFNAYGFYSTRNFYGKIPIRPGVIDLSRKYFGQGSSYQINQNKSHIKNKIQIGYEFAIQKDDRDRFINEDGIQGDKYFSQIESFNNFAVYVVDYLQINKWRINAGLRYDWNKLKAEDKFLENGDNSGSINLNSFNPSLGVNYIISKNQAVYTNISTSFETPSLSELSASPDGGEGLNTDLNAQKSINYEIGWKGRFNNKLNLAMAIFHIDTDNELIPFELEAFPDTDFYENAGSSKRDGVELELTYKLNANWKMTSSYTYSEFKFNKFIKGDNDYSDKQIPGVPKNMASLSIQYLKKDGLTFQANGNYIGSLYADNGNNTEVNSYLLLNSSIGYKFSLNKMNITPYFGVNNLFDTEYNDNIRINAFGKRYYEPAPNRNFYGGVKIKIM